LEASFDYLFRLLAVYIVPGVIAVAAYAAYALKKYSRDIEGVSSVYEETIREIIDRTIRVFIFVAALELLGHSFTPMVVWYFSKLPPI